MTSWERLAISGRSALWNRLVAVEERQTCKIQNRPLGAIIHDLGHMLQELATPPARWCVAVRDRPGRWSA